MKNPFPCLFIALTLAVPPAAWPQEASPPTLPTPPPKTTEPSAPTATQEQLESFLAETLNPARNYALPWLTDHVRQGRRLLQAFPDRAEEIQQALEPFAAELEHHRKGHTKFEGKWYTPGDWFEFEEKRGRELWDAFFKDGPLYELPGTVIPPDTALILLGIGLVSVLVLISLIVQSILSLRHHFSIMPIFGIGLPLLLLGLYAWFVWRAFQAPEAFVALPPPAEIPGQENSVRELIYHSLRDPNDGGTPSPNSIQVTPADADAFIARHVAIIPPSDPSFFRFTRHQIRVTTDDRDWIVYDAGTWFGRPMVFTYRVAFYGSSYQISGALGRAPIPARAVESAWNALDSFARKVASQARIAETYTPSKMDVKGIEFRRKAL